MPATHYTQWIYRKIRGRNGRRFEIRINCGNNHFDWDSTHPTDSIILNRLPILDFGKTKWQRFDEEGALVAPERTFVFKDSYTFSGKDGAGTPIAEVNLATYFTSVIPFIFNDTSGATIYHVWLSELNSDGSIKETYFYGHFDSSFISGLVTQITNPMTPNEMKLQNKTLKATMMPEILKAHTIEELISGSRTLGIPDGLVPGFQESDMDSAIVNPWLCGLVPVKDNKGADAAKKTITSADGFETDFEVLPNSGITEFCMYPGQQHNSGQDDLYGWGNNMYGVEDGFQGLTYTTILQKIGAICGFTFDSADSDNVFTEYLPKYEAFVISGETYDRYNLEPIGGTTYPFKGSNNKILDSLCVNYNIRFGVRAHIPNELHYGGNTSDLNYSSVLIDSAGSVSHGGGPLYPYLYLHSPINMIQGISGIRCIIKHSPYANNDTAEVFYMTIEDNMHVSLQDSTGGVPAYTFTPNSRLEFADRSWYDFITPETFPREKTLSDMLKIICQRFGYMIDWDIDQTTKLPKLILRDMLADTGEIPDQWKKTIQPDLLSGTETSERVLSKKNVKLKYPADESEVYCPTTYGESVSLDIYGRAKEWGRKFNYLPKHFINNAGEDLASQWNTHYREFGKVIDAFGHSFDTLDQETIDSGWIVGAHDFYHIRNGALTDSLYNFLHPLPSAWRPANWEAYLAVSYEDHGAALALDWDARLPDTNTIHDGVNTPDNRFNTVVAKANYYANVFLHDIMTEKRSFRSAIDNDGTIRNLKPNRKAYYRDDDGVARWHIIHSIVIDEKNSICDCEFVPKVDSSNYKQQDVSVKGAGGSGATTGGIIGNINSGNPTTNVNGDGYISKTPNTDSRNDLIPTADNVTGQRTKGHSLSQTANLHEFGTWDGATYILKCGVAPLGGFFAATQNGVVLQNAGGTPSEIQFNNPANTFHVGFKASATAISSNTIWTLPSADGLVNQFIKTNGSATLGFAGVASVLIAGTGITLSENSSHQVTINCSVSGTVTSVGITGAHGIVVSGSPITSSGTIALDISANGIALDRLAQIADQIVLGNISGGAANVIAVPISSILTNAVIINPATDTRNVIKGNNALGLVIEQSATGTKDLLQLQQDTSHSVLSFVNYYGYLTVGNSTDIDAAAPLKVHQGSSVGVYLRAASSGSNLLMRVENNSGTLLASLDHSANLNLGDMGHLSSIVASLNIVQANNTTVGVTFKESQTPGDDNLVQFVRHDDTVMGAISHKGFAFGGPTANSIVDVQANAVASALLRECTNVTPLVSETNYQNTVNTTNALATLLHNFTTTTDTVIKGEVTIKARQTAGAGAKSGGLWKYMFLAENKAGVLTVTSTLVMSTDHITIGGITIGVGAVNTTDVEINVTGVNAKTIQWSLIEFRIG